MVWDQVGKSKFNTFLIKFLLITLVNLFDNSIILFLKLSICNSLCLEFLLTYIYFIISKNITGSKYVKQYVTISDKRSLQRSKMNSKVP